jgi:hypothetical protein
MPRKIAVTLVLACALSSAFGCAVLARWRRSMSDLTLTLTVPRERYAIGEEVDLKVEVTNQTSKLVIFPKIDEGQAPQPLYSIRQPDGTTVIYDPLLGNSALRERKTLPRYLIAGIEPGNSIHTSMMPNDAVPLDQTGKYTVTAHFKWNEFALESEPVTFRMAAIHISNMVMSEFVRDPETPRVANPKNADTWGGADEDDVVAQISEDGHHHRLANAPLDWDEPETLYSDIVEWNLAFGEHYSLSSQDMPSGAHLVPIQSSGVRGGSEPNSRLVWTRDDLWLGWPEGKKLERFPWFRIPSPKPIAYGLRFLGNDLVQQLEEDDAFVIFEGEAAELGHAHIKTFINVTLETHEEHTPLRPIAQLGPDLVAAQVMIGQPEMGSPIVLAAIRNVPTGMQATFLRIDSKGAVVAKAQRALAGFKPLGPVAMSMRVRGALVEAAFPALNKYTNTLHVVRLTTHIDLQSIQPPIVSAAIQLEGPMPSMAIDYSHFPIFFPNGVGLLLRQPGDKAFFWTAVRGLKPLPFTLRDKNEALILGKRSSWYVLVNNGIRLRGEIVESFYEEYRPDPATNSAPVAPSIE